MRAARLTQYPNVRREVAVDLFQDVVNQPHLQGHHLAGSGHALQRKRRVEGSSSSAHMSVTPFHRVPLFGTRLRDRSGTSAMLTRLGSRSAVPPEPRETRAGEEHGATQTGNEVPPRRTLSDRGNRRRDADVRTARQCKDERTVQVAAAAALWRAVIQTGRVPGSRVKPPAAHSPGPHAAAGAQHLFCAHFNRSRRSRSF